MKSILASIVMILLLAACGDGGMNHAVLDQKDGVVLIVAEKIANGEQAGGIGTGFFIDENTILTNNHVVSDSTRVKVAVEHSSELYDVEVVESDPVADIAIVEIKDWDKFKRENHYKVLKLADPYDLQVSEEVFAIGHPWGLSWTVSKGILSAIDRKMTEAPKVLIQVDAHVYQGNSGGPLLNSQGEVIGINSLMLAQTGGSYGFALPVSMIERVMRDWKEYGETRWSFVGIKINEDLVKEVTPGSPAEQAGIKADDVIEEFTTSEGTYDPKNKNLSVAMAHHDSGEPVMLKVRRGDEHLEIRVDPVWKPSSQITLTPADGQ